MAIVPRYILLTSFKNRLCMYRIAYINGQVSNTMKTKKEAMVEGHRMVGDMYYGYMVMQKFVDGEWFSVGRLSQWLARAMAR